MALPSIEHSLSVIFLFPATLLGQNQFLLTNFAFNLQQLEITHKIHQLLLEKESGWVVDKKLAFSIYILLYAFKFCGMGNRRFLLPIKNKLIHFINLQLEFLAFNFLSERYTDLPFSLPQIYQEFLSLIFHKRDCIFLSLGWAEITWRARGHIAGMYSTTSNQKSHQQTQSQWTWECSHHGKVSAGGIYFFRRD